MDEKDKFTSKPWNLRFCVCPDPANRNQRCKPAEILMQLLNSNQLPSFVSALLKERRTIELGGDCHTIALALMTDLITAGRAQGWNWLQGYREEPDGKK